MECADLVVPMNYRRPSDGNLAIAVSRIRAKSPAKRQGILMINPGGPGGDGLDWPLRLKDRAAATGFDLIGFDPRGVGRSTSLQCESPDGERVELSRPTDAQFAAIEAQARADEERCRRTAGGIRKFVNTPNTARDMDVIRAVLGEQRINYYGISYGTYLGAVYGTMFPARLNRSVLDSSVNPDWVWHRQFQQQSVAATQNVHIWAQWVAARNKRYGFGTTEAKVIARVETISRRVRTRPVDVPDDQGGSQTFDQTGWDQLLGSANDVQHWDVLADLAVKVKAATQSKPTALSKDAGRALYVVLDRVKDTEDGVFPTVTCEAAWPTDLSYYERQMRLFRTKYPYGNGAMAAAPTNCTFRTFTPPETLPTLKRSGYPVGLVVQAELDTQTQYQGGPAMATRLGDNLITVRDSGTHGQYGVTPCVTKKVDDYLLKGVLPGSRVTCTGRRPAVPDDDDDAPVAPQTLTLEQRAR
ncbi:alpha/beta fold hydrolase [Kribbella antibiotica]|uniref:Alpha/beta fold hydrolase n=2 Tax=Kribbella antibiotica TaxID=190195 RepID=A0A4R4ZSD2_9ACTN|nr:alpha/beta fold hydrolase [Kribbella antibiotica]